MALELPPIHPHEMWKNKIEYIQHDLSWSRPDTLSWEKAQWYLNNHIDFELSDILAEVSFDPHKEIKTLLDNWDKISIKAIYSIDEWTTFEFTIPWVSQTVRINLMYDVDPKTSWNVLSCIVINNKQKVISHPLGHHTALTAYLTTIEQVQWERTTQKKSTLDVFNLSDENVKQEIKDHLTVITRMLEKQQSHKKSPKNKQKFSPRA